MVPGGLEVPIATYQDHLDAGNAPGVSGYQLYELSQAAESVRAVLQSCSNRTVNQPTLYQRMLKISNEMHVISKCMEF